MWIYKLQIIVSTKSIQVQILEKNIRVIAVWLRQDNHYVASLNQFRPQIMLV